MSLISKLWHLLDPGQRKGAIAVLCLMLVGMILETIGIGLVVPVIAIMTQNDIAARYPVLVAPLAILGNPDRVQLITASMLLLIGVYAVKAVFLTYNSWRQIKYVSDLYINLSQRLFAGYLRQPYSFHLQRNSAQLIHNTTHQARGVSNAIQQGMMFLSESLVLIGISLLLIKVEPLGTLLVVSALACVGGWFHRASRNSILRWGKAYQHHEGLRFHHLQQGLGGVKDVKLLGRESDFLSQYSIHSAGGASFDVRQSTLQAMPRLWLELLAVAGLATLVLVMLGKGTAMDAVLPTLGLFAAAAFRLMPSITRLLSTTQSLRFSLPVINTIFHEFMLLQTIEQPVRGIPMQFERTLEINHLHYQYETAVKPALADISLTVPKGSSVGFIGGSGAGKSTLIDVVLGLLTPTGGAVKVDGVDIRENMRAWQDKIGYVPQSIFLTDDTLRRNIAFGLPNDQINDDAVWRAIRAAQVDKFIDGQTEGVNTIVGERGIRLSGGQRQRIGIARALYHDPGVLVLDEATSSLDTETENGVMEAVRALHGKKTILIVAHRLSTVEHCDYIVRLEDGKIVARGETAEMLGKTAPKPAALAQ